MYKVKINEFEGPLDLLLHLIKESNIDIYDIKIADITVQYLDYIKDMESLNLSIASEYLVMAAELIEMKAKLLLPSIKDVDNDEYEEDLKENLIKRLIDYKNYKEITSTFKELEQKRSLIFTKLPTNIDEYKVQSEIKESQSISILLEAFSSFIERSKLNQPLHTKITSKEISINERIASIRDILRINNKVNFISLFDIWNREYFVITFLAILQMTKNQEIIIEQTDSFSDIYINCREETLWI